MLSPRALIIHRTSLSLHLHASNYQHPTVNLGKTSAIAGLASDNLCMEYGGNAILVVFCKHFLLLFYFYVGMIFRT